MNQEIARSRKPINQKPEFREKELRMNKSEAAIIRGLSPKKKKKTLTHRIQMIKIKIERALLSLKHYTEIKSFERR